MKLSPAIFFLLMLISQPSFAQTGKVIIIDTLAGNKKMLSTYKSMYSKRAITLPLIFYRNTINDIDLADLEQEPKELIDLDTYPNVVITDVFCKRIDILFDNKGGRVSILNIDKIKSDTIRISKWTIIKCGLTDTVSGGMGYYTYYNDSLDTTSWHSKTLRKK